MMDDFDTRLRDSLAERATDVDPTPALWREVERRAGRRRHLRWLSAAGLTAAAVVAAAVAVPGVIDAVRDRGATEVDVADAPPEMLPTAPKPTAPVGPTPPAEASEAPGQQGADVPPWTVTTDGRGIYLRRGSEAQSHPFFIDSRGTAEFVAFAVRPGSTPDDVTVAYLQHDDGTYTTGWFKMGDGEGGQPLPSPYQLDNPAAGGSFPAPVWSPDGRHLAWVEDGPDGVALRTLGWADGPGTGRTADDHAGFVVEGLPGGARFRAQGWSWTQAGPATTASGFITVTDDGLRAHAIPVERQGDGALAVTGPATPVGWPEGPAPVIDLADGEPLDPAGGPRYALRVMTAGEGIVDLALAWAAGGGASGELAVPGDLERTSDPTSIWMTARDDGVLVGAGGRAWLLSRDGATTLLPGTVWYAEFMG